MNPYRNERVHRWGLPAIDSHIPRREFVRKWIGKGLGELARFRIADKTGDRSLEEFVSAVDQAREDLECVERVLNEVWEMALKELSNLTEKSNYRRAQRVRSNDKEPPRRPFGEISSLAAATSGSV